MIERTSKSIYKDGSGVIVESQLNVPITSMSDSNMFDSLSEVGFILFRNFDVDIDSFNELVQAGSSRVTVDPMRESFGSTAQRVDAGLDAVGMHVEHGNNPFQPDMCWFYCELAAKRGSQTTVCDGYRVWEHMPADLKDTFLKKKIKYSRYIEGDKWKTLTKSLTPGIEDVDAVTLGNFRNLIDCESFHVELRENDEIYYEYTTSALSKEQKTGRFAFANSILGPSYNYRAPKITYEDDEDISLDTLSLLEQLFEDFTTEIDWVSGDVVVIDNRHIMHGRRAILDKKRSLFNAMSFGN